MITSIDFQDRDKEFLDVMNATFPGGLIGSPSEVLDLQIKVMTWAIGELTSKRNTASISGAMRWPWSQEYPLWIGPRVKDSV